MKKATPVLTSCGWFLAALLICVRTLAGTQPATRLRAIQVDGNQVIGTLKLANDVNGAPDGEFSWSPHGAVDASKPVDISAQYRAAHVRLIRTHDAFGPGDIDSNFTLAFPGMPPMPKERGSLSIFSNLAADPEDVRSFNFGPTDRLIESIVGAGAEPLFRIGRSVGSSATPPADFDRYAAVAGNIVRHYNGGWANGFHRGIRYWEIWNEPDFGFFWTGSPQEFYSLYEKTARAIKKADPAALVGGPAIAKPLDAEPFRDGFLEYVRAHQLPLDFFSWHFYTIDSNDPLNFADIARQVRSVLDRYGFTHTPSVLDEWNASLFDRELTATARASFIASALTYMVDAPVDIEAIYRADTSFRTADGAPDPVGHVLTVFGGMQQTPERVKASGGDDAGFTVLAGRSKDANEMQILVSNYEIAAKYRGPRAGGDLLKIPGVMDITLPARRSVTYANNGGYDLRVNVPIRGRYVVERYRMTEGRHFALVDRECSRKRTLHLHATLPAPGVEFISFKAAGDAACAVTH